MYHQVLLHAQCLSPEHSVGCQVLTIATVGATPVADMAETTAATAIATAVAMAAHSPPPLPPLERVSNTRAASSRNLELATHVRKNFTIFVLIPPDVFCNVFNPTGAVSVDRNRTLQWGGSARACFLTRSFAKTIHSDGDSFLARWCRLTGSSSFSCLLQLYLFFF